MALSKTDLYQVHLKPREAYLLFLAKGETDATVLPKPLTEADEALYADCLAASSGDSSNADSDADSGSEG